MNIYIKDMSVTIEKNPNALEVNKIFSGKPSALNKEMSGNHQHPIGNISLVRSCISISKYSPLPKFTTKIQVDFQSNEKGDKNGGNIFWAPRKNSDDVNPVAIYPSEKFLMRKLNDSANVKLATPLAGILKRADIAMGAAAKKQLPLLSILKKPLTPRVYAMNVVKWYLSQMKIFP